MPPFIDLNECAYADCEQECKNTVGSYYCYCNSGYTLNSNEESCDGKLFIIVHLKLLTELFINS